MSTEQDNLPFNPESLIGAQFSEGNSTELLVVPEGEYIAVSEPVTAESFASFDIKKGDRAGTKGVRVDVQWMINDESGSLKEYLGRSPKVKQGIMLDRGPGNSLEFGKGKNVALGRLREALKQNGNGQPWGFPMLGGKVAKIKVKHRMDGGKTYAEVSEVTSA